MTGDDRREKILTIELWALTNGSSKLCFAGRLERASQRLSVAAEVLLALAKKGRTVKCKDSGRVYNPFIVWREAGTGRRLEREQEYGQCLSQKSE